MNTNHQNEHDVKSLTDTAARLFPSLNNDHDEDFFKNLIEEYSSNLNVERQIKLFHAWCLDQQPGQIKNPRFRFRSWLENAAEYNSRRKMKTSPSLYSKTKHTMNEN